MAFHQLRLLASSTRFSANFPPFMPQCRSFQNCSGISFRYSTVGSHVKCGECSHLRIRKAGLTCKITTAQVKDLRSKVGHDSCVLKSIASGYCQRSAVRFQTPFSMGFPYTMNYNNILTSRCIESSVKLNSSSYGFKSWRFFSIKATQKFRVQGKLVNKSDIVSSRDIKSEGKTLTFKNFHQYKKKTNSVAVRSSNLDGGQVVLSNSSKNISSKTSNLVADAVAVQKPKVHVSESDKNNGKSGPCTLIKSSSSNQGTKLQQKKKSQVGIKSSSQPVKNASKTSKSVANTVGVPKLKVEVIGHDKSNVKSGSCTPITAKSSCNNQGTNSSQPVKKSASKTSKSVANTVSVPKPKEQGSGGDKKNTKASPSVSIAAKTSSNNQGSKPQQQKKPQVETKSSQPVKKSNSKTIVSEANVVGVLKPTKKVSGDDKKDMKSTSSNLVALKSNNNSQGIKLQKRKQNQLNVKKQNQLSNTGIRLSAAVATDTKIAFQANKRTVSGKSSLALKVEKAPLKMVDNPVTQELSKKKTPKSATARKLQKKAKILSKSDKDQRSNAVSVIVNKSPSGQTLKPLFPPSGKSVVVVESLTKAKVIQGYLGDMYEVLPSYGHVRDLAGRAGSIRPDDNFSVVWEVPSTAWTHLKSIKMALNGAENLILASDPDREGEAIAWHIYEMLQQQDALHEGITVSRVVFHEITESSIKSALQAPRDIDADLVHAYLARRALDYLIGFNISPLLWRKLPGCQSAGRVQSAALALICDREMEIDRFKPQEYWTVNVEFNKKIPGSPDKAFPSSYLTHFESNKLEKLSINSYSQAKNIEHKIISSNFEVVGCKRSNSRKEPCAPYRTSTLQQDAVNKLHFTALRTMMLAQKLYEGVKLSDTEAIGLITYMRTDGMHVSDVATNEIRSLVIERYGKDFATESTRKLMKVKNAQEAHEAIRPTSIWRLPSMLSEVLDEDSLKLYSLIWCRTMASQMKPAIIDQMQIDFGDSGKSLLLRSTCSATSFLGYQSVYKDTDAANIENNEKDVFAHEQDFKALCTLKVGDAVSLREVELKQHSTQPPPRYSEGSLVKKLEELGIGRPSTYAATMKILQDRKYMTVKARYLYPEFRGRMVSAFLSHHFSEVMNYDFTAHMETELDNVSAGITEWRGVLNDYWTRFSTNCKLAEKVNNREVEKMLEEVFEDFLFASLSDKSRTCPSCLTGTLRFKASRFGVGYFIGCDQHPKCKYIAKTIYGEDDDDDNPQEIELREPKLLGLKPGSDEKVLLKNGPYGFYLQLGDDRKGHLPKRVSLLHSQLKEVESITLEQALYMLSYPIILGNNPVDGEPVYFKLSKYGYSIKHGRCNAVVPKTEDPSKMNLEKALKLLDGPTVKRTGRPVRKQSDRRKQPEEDE